ncbi:MAG: SPFH domain-containing protein [Candidatus Nanopelagicales bacterium]
MVELIIAAVIALFAIVLVGSTVKIVPQATAGVVERLGRFNRVLTAGLTIIIPVVDRVRARIDLREQVVSFPPQPVITSDNLVVNIDSVIYFQVTDPKSATYEIQNYLQGIEQLTVTTLRNVIGSLDLEETLTSRDNINQQLRGVLDEATGKWGIRVNRVELKAIDPPASVQQSMEKQMRAERDKRAAILSAEGSKQAAILEAEGGRTAAILRAEGQAQAQVLRAQGESEAIAKVFNAVNSGHATDQVMAYQYLQALPLLAQGSANKVFVIPAELSGALASISRAFGTGSGAPVQLPTSGLSADAVDAVDAIDAGAATAAIAGAARAAAAGQSGEAGIAALTEAALSLADESDLRQSALPAAQPSAAQAAEVAGEDAAE